MMPMPSVRRFDSEGVKIQEKIPTTKTQQANVKKRTKQDKSSNGKCNQQCAWKKQ